MSNPKRKKLKVVKSNEPKVYEITNQKLMQFHQELQQLNSKSVLGFMLKKQVVDFYKLNQDKVQSCLEAIHEIQQSHLELDENGHPKLSNLEDKNSVILLDGKKIEDLNKAVLELMNKIVFIR